MRTRTIVLAGSFLLASLIPATGGATAPADGSLFTIEATLWQCQLGGGDVGSDASVTITLKRSSGALVGNRTVQASGFGSWSASFCDAGVAGNIRPGDRITIRKSQVDQKTVIVPDIQPRVDVATNVIRLVHPANTTDVEVQVLDCLGGMFCAAGVPFVPTGTPFKVDTDPTDIHGGDRIQVELLISNGLQRWLATGPTPYLAARAGSASVKGAGKPGSTVKVTVKRPDGTVRGTGSVKAKGAFGAFALTVRKNGKVVKVRPGDLVIANLYPGARVKVVKAGIALDPATGAVTGTCAPNTPVLLSAQKPGAIGFDKGVTSGTGAFAFSAAGLGVPTPSGARIEARCENGQGNQQALSLVAP